MTITDFNRGGEFSADLLDEFGKSGNFLVDGLWTKSATSIKQRDAIAISLFETLLAGSSRSLRARFHSIIRRLPLPWKLSWSLYGYRTMRGNSALWADTVVALLVRMPLATTLYQSEHYGYARAVIQKCLYGLMAVNADGLDYEKYLWPRMSEILDVMRWYAENFPNEKKDAGIVAMPISGFLYNHREHGKLTGSIRKEFEDFYKFLDDNINVHLELNGQWSTLHKYMFDALEEDRGESRLLKLSDNADELVRNFTISLSNIVGTALAKYLVSDDSRKLADFLASLAANERAGTLLLMLKAREFWSGNIALNPATTYGVLHRELHKFSCWKDLNDTIRRLADLQMEASDQQMAELVDSLAGAGNIIAEVTVRRALRCCKTGEYPKTLYALKSLPVTGEITDPPFFDETLKRVRRGLLWN